MSKSSPGTTVEDFMLTQNRMLTGHRQDVGGWRAGTFD